MTNEEITEMVLRRRETEGNRPWPRTQWDYTEWEEAFDEIRGLLGRGG